MRGVPHTTSSRFMIRIPDSATPVMPLPPNFTITEKALDFDGSITQKFDLPTFSWHCDQHHNGVFAMGRQRIMDVRVLKVLQKRR